MQAANLHAMREHRIEQAEPPEHGEPDGLQQESRAHRAQHGGLLEDIEPMPVARQQCRAGLSGRAVTDDGDA
jgi:hypothetical protein